MIVGLAIVFFEEKLIYFPTVGGVGPSPGEEVWLTASDGVRIHGWFLRHPEARTAILHLHGNAGNLEDRRELVLGLQRQRASVLAIDYRGYGRSEGRPGEEGLYRDARAAYDWLRARTEAERIFLHGESLGAGPACELAATVPCGGLIVQSAFTRVADMASAVLPIFPARWFLRTKYDNLSKVARIGCRKLFLHGREDTIVPFAMGERLFAGASEPKEFTAFPCDHNDFLLRCPGEFYARVGRFLDG